MFDVSAGELLVIGAVALVVIGPKELPGMLRTVGQAVGKMKRMAGEFRTQFDDAMREADMQDVKKTFDEPVSTATAATSPCARRGSGPQMPQATKARIATASTAGTNQPAT